MFKALTNKIKELKHAIGSVSAIVDEADMEITKQGIVIKAIDPSQIAMVIENIPSSMFDKYELDNEMKIGINFLELSKILRRANMGEDVIEIEINTKVTLKFIGKTLRKFSFGLIETSSAPSREPKIETTAVVKMSGNLIKNYIADIESISTKVNLNVTKDKFIITSSSDGETTSGTIEISDENLIGKEVKEEASATFSTEYLKNLIKEIDVDTVVSLELKKDAPLVIRYNAGEASIKYYLAPRIDS